MADDALDKKPAPKVDTLGATHGKGAAQPRIQHAVVAPPDPLPPDHGVKDAERLKQLMQRPAYQQAEKIWLDRLGAHLQLATQAPAKKLGFGPWKKKHASPEALCQALNALIRPVFEKEWKCALPEAVVTTAGDAFAFPWAELPGEPPLHPAYAADADAFAFRPLQDDTKHVAHAYVMALSHVWFRQVLHDKRVLGEEATVKQHGLPAEQLYVLEVNLCQYYVPQASAAYFEGQPLRALGREIANRFRKVAFGGQ